MRAIDNKEKLFQICKNNDIVFLAIFGSFLRGDFTEESDIDLLVRFSKPKSLLELVRIERIFEVSTLIFPGKTSQECKISLFMITLE
ncbi:MAG: nucleotidyltransferase domain-containing protein [Candidatus Omnitrophica bacterium]|nr:nucleotidyltransferase domain-containing protein [Candidatus Omnitrophota bacterium]